MRIYHWLIAGLLLSSAAYGEDIDVWEQLIPESERQAAPAAIDHNAPLDQPVQQNLNVSVNKALDGKTLRIPGFIVPLESDGELIKAFLLVPYFGACLHYPPPPPNQIVYVTYKQGVQLEDIWDPVWVEGTIHTKIQDVEGVATVGYSISEPQSIVLYSD
ncbi:DUF3299 domain-containing protein [Agarivorans sp. QJM3NY_29]|uniref:DUF3299 domain-containing protein n=1 Tax=unclassified Agarivorans TaxID=2636026 RepID=UPI003D7D08D6